MKIILLGTGTPVLDAERQQSALVVSLDNTWLLFDAGRGVSSQISKVGIKPCQVDAIFITHHHYDHICDLGEFILTAWYNGRETPIHIYGPHGTKSIVTALLDQVFARDIAFTRFTSSGPANIHDLVQVTDIPCEWEQDFCSWKITAAGVEHGHALGLSYDEWPCLGYRIDAGGKIIAISGDAVDCKGLDALARNADVLIQCCYLAEAEITTPSARNTATHVIASSGQVGKIAALNQVKKLVLTHIRPKSQALMQSMEEDIRKDFDGELIVGKDLMVIEL